ncbi:MAG TPA: hypothetical protein VFE42_20315 [Chloroflexota bacterium]|nr:hypothetical protein [Chloroflexota bacterium]
MLRRRDHLAPGMAVLDAAAAPVGQIQEVQDGAIRVRLHLEIAVPWDVVREIGNGWIVLDRRTAEWTPLLLGVEEVRPPGSGSLVCCACGAIAGIDQVSPYLRKKDAWFCAACWQALAPHEVARFVQEVALRGVPFS